MWQVAEFRPTTLFSLRPYNATTSGGKTLVTPTPYALKMALLDAAIRVYGREQGEAWFPHIRDLQTAIQLPKHLIVNNTFIKILRPHKAGTKDLFGTGLEGPMGNTIAYREMVFFGGPILMALQDQVAESEGPPLTELFSQVNYLGKRGGFMQFSGHYRTESLENNFARLDAELKEGFQIHGLLQMLDDCGPKMTFEHADIFSGKRVTLGKDNGRIARPVLLPYRPVRSSRSFTLYERIER